MVNRDKNRAGLFPIPWHVVLLSKKYIISESSSLDRTSDGPTDKLSMAMGNRIGFHIHQENEFRTGEEGNNRALAPLTVNGKMEMSEMR